MASRTDARGVRAGDPAAGPAGVPVGPSSASGTRVSGAGSHDDTPPRGGFTLTNAMNAVAAQLTAREAAVGVDHVSNLALMRKLAMLARCAGRFKEATMLVERELAVVRKMAGDEHADAAIVMRRLATLYRVQSARRPEALPLLRQALKVLEAQAGAESEPVADTLNSLAVLYSSEGDAAQAERCHTRSLRIRHKLAKKRRSRGGTGSSSDGVGSLSSGAGAANEEHAGRNGDADDGSSGDELCEEFKMVPWDPAMSRSRAHKPSDTEMQFAP